MYDNMKSSPGNTVKWLFERISFSDAIYSVISTNYSPTLEFSINGVTVNFV